MIRRELRLSSVFSLPALWLVALLALGIHVWLFTDANPTAALRLRLTRPEAAVRAQRFLAEHHVTIPDGYQRAVSFSTRDSAKNYLEITLGLPRANRVMQAEGFVYRWLVRWFRPGTQREYYVSIDPDGRVIGYFDVLPDNAKAQPTPHPREVARTFLRRTAGIDVEQYALKDRAVTPRSNRKDFEYTWERRNFRLGKATQRVDVTVTDNRVIAYRRYLHVPEAFAHRLEREQNKGDLLAELSLLLALLLGLAGAVTACKGIEERRTLFLRGLVLPAALVALVGLLNDVNLLPLHHAQFDVTDTEFSFWTYQALGMFLSLVGSFFMTFFLVVIAEWIYRRAYPEHPPISYWFTRRGFSSVGGRKRLKIGYGLLLLHLGYVTLFYVVVERYFHGWSPANVPYDDLFSTSIPWAYALLVGIQAAVSEEFLFRVLAISWLKRVVKVEWLAILIPAVIWGFGHCSYAQKPFFIRGVELTIIGVLFGIVFVRYGPLPTLISHACFNAVLTGESFLGSLVWVERLHAVWVLLAVLLPAAIAWWLVRRNDSAADEQPMTNAEFEAQLLNKPDTAQPPLTVPDDDPPYQPLPTWIWPVTLAPITLCVILILVLVRIDESAERFSWREKKTVPFSEQYIDHDQALRIARKELARQGASVEGWISSTVCGGGGTDDVAEEYLRQYLSKDDVDELIARTTTPNFMWQVKWQKPLARESWVVHILADGSVWDVRHTLPDEAPGDSLTEKDARTQAARALTGLGFNLAHFRLTGTQKYDHPRRSSYAFTWEAKDIRIGKARFCTEVTVDGNRVDAISRYVDIPDSYRFAQAKVKPIQVAASVLTVLLILVLLALLIIRMLKLPTYRTPWRAGVWPATVGAVLMACLWILALPVTRSALPSTLSPTAYFIGALAVAVALTLCVVALMLAILSGSIPVWHMTFPDIPGPRYWWRVLWQPWRHAQAWGDAVLIQPLIFSIAACLGTAAILTDTLTAGSTTARVIMPDWLVKTLSPPEPLTSPGVDMLHPVAFGPAIAIVSLLFVLACWPMLMSLGKTLLRGSRLALGAFLLLLALPLITEILEGNGSLVVGISLLGGGLVILALYRFVLRTNPLILPISIAVALLVSNALGLLEFHAYRLPAAGILLAVGLCFLVALAGAQRDALRRRAEERARCVSPDIPEPPSVLSDEVLQKYYALRSRAYTMPIAEDDPESAMKQAGVPAAAPSDTDADAG